MKGAIFGLLAILATLALGLALAGRTSQNEQPSPLIGRWIDLSPLPAPRQEVAVTELEGRIYVIGGFKTDGSTADTVEVYDPAADRWELAAPLPLGLHHAAAASASGRIYVIGGLRGSAFEPVDTVFAYDPQTDTWTPRAPMPTGRGALAVGIVDGKIYAAGGSPPARENDFAMYDPDADTWAVLPAMPIPRNHLAGAGIGGKFYAVGGRSGGIGGITGVLDQFDPSTGAWAKRTPMPTARGGIASVALDGLLYVFGGEGNRRSPVGVFDQVEAYNPETDTWQRLEPMAVPRHGLGAAAMGSRIYVPGGATVEGFGATAAHQAFQTNTGEER